MKIIFIIFTVALSFWLLRNFNRREKRDWKEFIPYYKRNIDLAEQEADELLQRKLPFIGDGYCYQLWELRQEILKKKYNINWNSPADLNEHNLYD